MQSEQILRIKKESIRRIRSRSDLISLYFLRNTVVREEIRTFHIVEILRLKFIRVTGKEINAACFWERIPNPNPNPKGGVGQKSSTKICTSLGLDLTVQC